MGDINMDDFEEDIEATSESVQRRQYEAEQGNATAQFDMGTYYELGFGVEMNPHIAVEWYTRAALQGHIWAAFCFRNSLL